MESFRVKKNSQARGSSAIVKESMNKTAKVPIKGGMKENKAENCEPVSQNGGSEEAALRESMLLIEKIEKLTREEEEPNEGPLKSR